MRSGDLSAAPEAAAQPGPDPGPGQAEHATEYSDDPLAEYTPAYSSGSFTEFIAATSEDDIPPFSPSHCQTRWPRALTDTRRRTRPTLGQTYVRRPSLPLRYSAPDAWGQDEPAVPSGGAPDAFGRGGLSTPDRDSPALMVTANPQDSGHDLSGDAADTPVSGFHALIRLPRPAPAAERPSPPSERVEWASPPHLDRAARGGADRPARGVAYPVPPGCVRVRWDRVRP